jgi:hypothetical protein
MGKIKTHYFKVFSLLGTKQKSVDVMYTTVKPETAHILFTVLKELILEIAGSAELLVCLYHRMSICRT